MARPDAVNTRERRVIIAATVLVVAAIVVTYAVLPFARHWQARELALSAAQQRVAYLHTLIGRTATLESAALDGERVLASQTRRVLHARSSTLAANALQTFLQDAADASRLAVTRLEVSPDDSARSEGASAAVTYVPAAFAAYGDIGGVTTLLDVVAAGPRVMSIERLTLLRNAALLGAPDVVQVTLTLRAPVLPP